MTFSFVTYNIHKGIGNDRLYRLQRIVEICRELNPDFLALQEVDKGVPRSRNDDIAHVLAEELGYHYTLGINVKLRKGAYGNATLSRFPVRKSSNLDITWSIKKKRGCLNSIFETPAGDLAVMNFHLGLASLERNRQIKKIIHSHFYTMYKNIPLVMLGDTNDRKNKINGTLGLAGLSDAGAEKSPRNRTFPAYAPLIRLDKIFFNQRLEVQEYRVIKTRLSSIASDHLPVLVRLKAIPPIA
ncbi:MAG: endonuclease/exonuclease/phosphatase family protein [Spirochaetales bacterium]|nr:endonuclease/exonuclease/phosphatase family protein [Spirochaetales bacterium]